MIKPLFPVTDYNIDATTVAIIGSGPNVTQGIDRIPPAAYRFTLNGSIQLMPDADAWVCVDMNVKNYGYWRQYNQLFAGTRIFHLPLAERALEYDNPAPMYWAGLESRDEITPDDPAINPARIRGMYMGSVASVAAQIAYIFGERLKRIIYCGIDMSGDTHFDGSRNITIHGDCWPCVPAFDALNGWLADHGVECVTVSDTKLALEMI